MPLLETEPNLIIQGLLTGQWDSTNVGREFKTAWISTGDYDNDAPNPEITLDAFEDDTTPDGIDPSGAGLTSWVDGVGDIQVWVPYITDEYDSSGQARGFRWDLATEVHRILENNQSGTTDDNGDAQLTRIEPGSINRFVGEGEPVIYRATIPVGYQYHTAPE